MSVSEVLALAGAGLAAGTINTVVGSGSLVTFPTLLALGYPPLLANVTNNVGVLPGSFTGLAVSGAELRGQRSRLFRLATGSVGGSVLGAVLLLRLPAGVFDAVVPALILLACLLVAAQPRITAALGRRERSARRSAAVLWGAVALTGVYGGYFGAAQGVILIAILGVLVDDTLPRLNAAKNALAGLANLAAATVFALVTEVAWSAALTLAVGAAVGGLIGPRIGRRLPPAVYRTIIVVVGVTVSVVLLLR